MTLVTSHHTLEQMLELQIRDQAELNRLAEEREMLERKLKLNAECTDFTKFVIERRAGKIADRQRVAHRSSPWVAGYYSHDAD